MPWYYDNMREWSENEDTMSEKWSNEIVKNIPLLFYSIAIILHSVGIVLLVKLRRKRNQDFIILNLSVSEVFTCLLDMAQNILTRDRFVPNSAQQAVPYIIIVNCCLFVVPSFLIIITLTIDRFLEVFLNIKYELYFSKSKLKIVLATHWLVGATTGVILLTIKVTSDVQVRLIIFMFIFPVLQGTFLIIAIITYSYIYRRFRKAFKQQFLGKVTSSVSPRTSESEPPAVETVPTNSLWKSRFGRAKRIVLTFNADLRKKRSQQQQVIFRKRNFFAPTLILITFVLFVVIPDMLNLLFHYAKMIKWTEDTQNILLCLYSLGFITDGFIYIFFQRHLRNMLLKICSRKKWVQQVTSTTYHEPSH